MNNTNSWISKLFKISSYIPLVWVCLLYLFAIRAWISLGHFPLPSTDDPKYLGLDFHYNIIWYGNPVFLINVPVWIGLLIITIKLKIFDKTNLIIFIAGIFLIIMQLFIDPFEIMNWYMD